MSLEVRQLVVKSSINNAGKEQKQDKGEPSAQAIESLPEELKAELLEEMSRLCRKAVREELRKQGER